MNDETNPPHPQTSENLLLQENRELKKELDDVNHYWIEYSERLDWLEERLEEYKDYSGTIMRMHSDYYNEFLAIKEDAVSQESGKMRIAKSHRVKKDE
tara:strand:- start:2904 stop:3197 length:294 start_codon:yes stop_codon:yes gene_type:complete